MKKIIQQLKQYELYYRHEIQCFLIGLLLGAIIFQKGETMKKTKKKIVKKKNKTVSTYQKALNKKLKDRFPDIKIKNLGDGMSEISFG